MIRVLIVFSLFFSAVSSSLSAQSLIEKIFVNKPTNYDLKGNISEFEEVQLDVVSIEIDSIKLDTVGCVSSIRFDKLGKEKNAEYCVLQLKIEYKSEFDQLNNEINQINLNSKNILKLDSIGNVIERKNAVRDSSFFGKWVYKYDNRRNQVERIGFIEEDFIERWKHIYDTNNNRVKEVMLDEHSDSIVYIERIFHYDNKGNVVQQKYRGSGDSTLSHIDYFNYDNRNNMVKWERKENGEIISSESYSYVYDTEGNWIEKRVFCSDILKTIYKRRISYYE